MTDDAPALSRAVQSGYRETLEAARARLTVEIEAGTIPGYRLDGAFRTLLAIAGKLDDLDQRELEHAEQASDAIENAIATPDAPWAPPGGAQLRAI